MESAAPYVPFRTFLTAIETLERGCPNQLDRSVWPSYSGAIRGQLLAAFRFLGLMDETQAPTPELRDLLARRDDRPALLRRLIEKRYRPLASLDLAHTSPHQLEEAMRGYGLSGATHKKAVSFFLRAAQYSGMPLSVLLRSKTRGAAPRRRKPPTTAESVTTRTVELRSGGHVTLTAAVDLFALDSADREFVFELADRIQRYGNDA
jgi:hypothetical protein